MHLGKVEAVLATLRKVIFTANPPKCAKGLAEAKYVGYVVGRGLVKPPWNKVETIQIGSDWSAKSGSEHF